MWPPQIGLISLCHHYHRILFTSSPTYPGWSSKAQLSFGGGVASFCRVLYHWHCSDCNSTFFLFLICPILQHAQLWKSEGEGPASFGFLLPVMLDKSCFWARCLHSTKLFWFNIPYSNYKNYFQAGLKLQIHLPLPPSANPTGTGFWIYCMDGLCGSLVFLDAHLPGPGGKRKDLGLPIG